MKREIKIHKSSNSTESPGNFLVSAPKYALLALSSSVPGCSKRTFLKVLVKNPKSK